MSTTTGFPPKATTVGCGSDIYMNGYIYPGGPLAPGSSCFAPILEITNASCEVMTVRYASRVDCDTPDALVNNTVVPPRAFILITGLLPSIPGAPSKIFVEDSCGGGECYTLEHDLEQGYCICPFGDASIASHCLKLHVVKDPYPPHFCGCQVPSWGNTVIVPARIVKRNSGAGITA